METTLCKSSENVSIDRNVRVDEWERVKERTEREEFRERGSGFTRRKPYTLTCRHCKPNSDSGPEYEGQLKEAESMWCGNSTSESRRKTFGAVTYGRKTGKLLLDHSIAQVPEGTFANCPDVARRARVVRPWHVRVSDFFVLLDFCRNEMMFRQENLSRDKPLVTVPPLTFRTANTVIKTARMFGEVLDPIKKCLGNISVVRGMEPKGFSDGPDAGEHRWIPGEGRTHSIEFVTPKCPNLEYRGLREKLLKDARAINCSAADGPDFEGNRVRVTIRNFDPSHNRTSADGEAYPWTE